jgi:AraC-like DNA-binding protein
MIDPLAEIVTLLQPAARFSKVVSGADDWCVQRANNGQPFYCAILEGRCWLTVDGQPPIALQAGDFVLIPASQVSSMSSTEAAAVKVLETLPVAQPNGEFRIGMQNGPADIRLLVGHCSFASPDATLLVSLLPQLVHVRGEPRLVTLVHLVGEESRGRRPAREVILERLLEVLLIEALRSAAGTAASPGLLRGLADERLAVVIRLLHENPTRSWTVVELAKHAALSRSAFFERFNRAVGMAPMAYLLAWRMALAKKLLRHKDGGIADIAERVGYGSASAFSVAFTRYVGLSPTLYAREGAGDE